MRLVLALPLLAALASAPLRAQDTTATPPLEIGAMAPDFAMAGATRHGVLRDSIRLSEFRGKTVVLGFFFRLRTPG